MTSSTTLSPRSRYCDRLIVAQLVKKFPPFIKLKPSSPHHKIPPLDSVLCQINSVDMLTHTYSRNVNIIFPSMSRSFKLSILSDFLVEVLC